MPVTLIKSKWSSGDLVFFQGPGYGASNGIMFGEDGSGLDIKFFGDTASAYMLWDQSADTLSLQGAVKVLLGTSTSTRNTYATAADVVQFFTNCTASSGICTGLDFEHAIGYQGSTSLQATAIRGVLRVLTGSTSTSGYNEGAAGYILMAGTINGDGKYYGVRGVVMNGGTWTACTEVAAGCFEYNNGQAVSSGRTAILLLKNNTSPAATVADLFYVYNGQKITYALEFSHLEEPVSTASDSTNVTHKIKVKIGSTEGYLHVFSD
jgi:hypothetical protein